MQRIYMDGHRQKLLVDNFEGEKHQSLMKNL